MQSIFVGILFLLVGAGVYAFNTESHGAKITFARFGLNVGETETAAILLGLGVFFIVVGAIRQLRDGDDEDGGTGREQTPE